MRRAMWIGAIVLLAASATVAKPSPKASAKNATSDSARAAVNALNQKEEEACRSMDNKASAALWADDGVDLIQGLQPMIGKAAIVKWYDSLTPQLREAKMEYCTVDWHQIKIEGDWAWEWAITRQKIDFPPPQKSFESDGKMLFILRKQPSGEWKIELESWSSIPGPEGPK